jgi:hypothetical protein
VSEKIFSIKYTGTEQKEAVPKNNFLLADVYSEVEPIRLFRELSGYSDF